MGMTPDLPPSTDRQLWRIVQWAVAVSLGAMAAFLWSVKAVNPTLQFQFSLGAVAAFLIGATSSFLGWRVMAGGGRRTKSRLITFSAVLCLVTFGAFAYGMRGVASERISDVAVGTALAFLFLGGVGFLLWRTGKFFEAADAKQTREEAKKLK